MSERSGARAARLLVVEDEPTLLRTVVDALKDRGHSAQGAASGSKALELLAASAFDVVVTDLRLPGATGLEVLRAARNANPDTAVLLMTAYGTVPTAVAAMQGGAANVLTKPFELEVLLGEVERLLESAKGLRGAASGQRAAPLPADRPQIIGASEGMCRLLEDAERAASCEATVLILGESGTGKELIARTVHAHSSRSRGPLVTVNCAAIPETLAEAELFGAERGAYSGATQRRDGRFIKAHQGTLFLDEVGELSLPIQAKLLRVLEEGTVQRLGSDVPLPVNVRLVAATHRDLREQVDAGRFRADLWFRLNVLVLSIPPLRERVADLPLLIEHFVARYAEKLGRPPMTVAPETVEALALYPWPGNVRELQNILQRAMVLSRSTMIGLDALPPEVLRRPAQVSASRAPASTEARATPGDPLDELLRSTEREHLCRVLEASGGNRSEAARRLGMSRKHLWHKLKQHGIP